MLECTQHPLNSFWTLTYNDTHVPHTEGGLQTLRAKELTDFMKRLRKDYQPSLLRYYNVGEYGEQTERPHYHLALFNYPSCLRGYTQPNRRGICCEVCSRVQKIWDQGNVYAGQLEDSSAAYIAGYITKKLTSKDDSRLLGREPEFSRKSLKPGIGAGFIHEVASTLLLHNLDQLDDVPTSLNTGGQKRPIGRYLTRKLREAVGKLPGAPESVLQAKEEEMQPLRAYAQANAPRGFVRETLKQTIIDLSEAKYQKLLARSKIYKKRGTI